MKEVVLIVGAGPAGLATSACLNYFKIPNIVIERDDCYASLWKKRAYDRLKLHLAKQYCELPYFPYSSNAPVFIPRDEFVKYLDDYVSKFNINVRCNRNVESAIYDQRAKRWKVEVKNTDLGVFEVYVVEFLVVATGENSEGMIPDIYGLDGFEGSFMHSNQYANGKEYKNKDVLVVGCGNSGLEIAYDLFNHGANTSIVARGPVHIVTKEIVLIGMKMLEYLPTSIVDSVTIMLSNLRFGDISRYGFHRPKEGPFRHKEVTGRSPTIDVGAMDEIKLGNIQVFPAIKGINGKEIQFENGEINQYDAIIFATGYRSTVRNWLKGANDLFNENGMPKPSFPNHWIGKNGIYCAGFSSRGLLGIANDAQNIARDINSKFTAQYY